MNTRHPVALALAATLFAACGKDAGAAASPTGVTDSLTSVLSGITDAKTAEAAKARLESMATQLDGALANLKSAASTGAKEAGGAIGEALQKALDVVTPELRKAAAGAETQIGRLQQNPEVQKVLGPVLDKLKAALPR